jgi:hypothetical protein
VTPDSFSAPTVLFHFSEDSSLQRFVPHVPRSNPSHQPAVWAIDEAHAPLYWFPRDCPRVTAWPRNDAERIDFERAFCTTARRVHALQSGWLDAMRTTNLFRYTLPASTFSAWPEASGQWISSTVVEPLEVVPFGDLLDRHAAAEIDLRIVPDLWPLHDLAISKRWDFSIVRVRNAAPRRSDS